MHAITRSLLTSSLLLAGALDARAQCLEWSEEFFLDGVDGAVNVIEILDTGSGPEMYVGGNFTQVGHVAARNIARWDGTRWWPLGTGTSGGVNAIEAWDDGTGVKIFAGGGFAQAGGVNVQNVARWNGTSWSSMTSGTNGAVHALEVFDDGSGPKLFAAGAFTSVFGTSNTRRIARWDGSAWSAVGFGATNTIFDLEVYDDGSVPALYATGTFPAVGTVFNGDTPASFIARWTGAAWDTSFGGLQNYGETLRALDDGGGTALFVGGAFNTAGGQAADRVARYSSSGWTGVGFGLNTHPLDFGVFDSGNGPELYATGPFNNAGYLARYDPGTNWSAVGGGLSNSGLALAVHDYQGTPNLYVGVDRVVAGSVEASGLLRWDGVAFGLHEPGAGVRATNVQATCVHDDGSGPALYVAGLQAAGGTPISGVARWDGSAWSQVGAPSTTALTMVSVPSGPLAGLYAGGSVTASSPSGFAHWDGASWTQIPTMFTGSSSITALVYTVDGTGPAVYAAGEFPGMNGAPMTNVARWDGTAWSNVGTLPARTLGLVEFDDGSGPTLFATGVTVQLHKLVGGAWTPLGPTGNGVGLDLVVFDDGTGPALHSAGFQNVGGQMNRVAKWNGTAWTSVGGGANSNVFDLQVFDDGAGAELYATGEFGTVGGVTASRLAKWDGTAWSAVGGGIDGSGERMAVLDDGRGGGSDLFVLGGFTTAGTTVSRRVARWEGCGGAGSNYCFGDGSATACPCANASAVGAQQGCLNSFGTGARLTATGVASLANDSITLAADGMPNSSALYFQGTTRSNGGLGTVFGDGLRCAGGSVTRLGTKINAGGTSQYPVLGDASVSVRGAITLPGTRTYQVWYRNSASFCTPDGFNLSNGTQISWGL